MRYAHFILETLKAEFHTDNKGSSKYPHDNKGLVKYPHMNILCVVSGVLEVGSLNRKLFLLFSLDCENNIT